MNTKFNRGFTLIELLVVIAVIGVLSAVVLTNLNSARGKASNASIKSTMAGLKRAAQVYFYDNNGTYDGFCQTIVTKQLAALRKESGATSVVTDGTGSATTVTCNDLTDQWAVQSPLKVTEGTTNNTFWCVDESGYTGLSGSSFTASTFDC